MGFRFEPADDGDFLDGREGRILTIKDHIASVRDFRAAVAQLALAVDKAAMDVAVLLVLNARISLPKMRQEWGALQSVFRDKVSSRLQLVAMTTDDSIAEPAGKLADEIVERLRTINSKHRIQIPRIDRSFEVLKVLLVRWLANDGPIPVGKLQELTGLSYPTVAKSIEDLDEDIARSSNRGVSLRRFPTERWSQLLALGRRVRSTVAFFDRAGRPGRTEDLVRRLQRKVPTGVAIGGVLAARHWDPDFDLDGTPRIDLCVHCPSGWMDLDFVSHLDPTLTNVPSGRAAALVLHGVNRDDALFTRGQDSSVWADPVETLMDLHEMRLRKQADDLVRHLRSRR